MPRHAVLRPTVVVGWTIAILCSPVLDMAARAQTADAFNPGANQVVETIAIQPDGKVIVAGGFTGLGGGSGATTRNHIGRLNADGTVDPDFNPGANGPIHAVTVQPDGKILIGGTFTSVGGGTGLTTPRSRIARLNADGTVDTAFNPSANNTVFAIALQQDGKILVGGEFSTMGIAPAPVTPRSRLARLNPDGSPDSFNPGASKLPAGASAIVYTLAVQPDGKILAGGYFNGLGGGTGASARNYIGRLNADGSVDGTFDPGATSIVNAIALQADGMIVVGGNFIGLGAGTGMTSRGHIGRLTTDGVVDPNFNPGAESEVLTLAVQADGKILAGGSFKWLGANGGPARSERNYIGRLDPSGTVDTTFNPGADNVVNAIALQADGATVAAGIFLSTGGPKGNGALAMRSRIARFAATTPSVQTLTHTGGGSLTVPSNFSWARSGSAPEVTRVTFAASFDGSSYTVLSNGARVPGGWAANNVAGLSDMNRDVWIKAQGFYGTGYQNGSGSIVETILFIPAGPKPTMTLGATSLYFGALISGATFTNKTGTQVVPLIQTGAGTVTWTATPDQPWLQVSPTSGTGPANLSLSVVGASGLPANGTAFGSIALVFTGAANSPGPITVRLFTTPDPFSFPPFGIVDTPTANRTGVTGAIPFTGWALDDLEVTRVMICRSAVSPEVAPVDPNCGGNAGIFVGFGTFIDGARPDVSAAFSGYPRNTRAGWGFMVLTNMLPNQGNGTYPFQVYAQDVDGHTVLLGTRTMTCANASATLPFGTIDTPVQGGTAAGSNFVNFGWALTQNPKSIPIDGSTIGVYVDGVLVGNADYNHYRADIAAVFPGLANSNGAVGFKILDTTTLANGLHTIAWVVTDSGNNVEGLGSRFFTVNNGAAALTAAAVTASSRAADGTDARTRAAVAGAPFDMAPVVGRRGWDLDAPWRQYAVSAAGRTVIRGEEVDRFELALGEHDGERYSGYLRTGDALAALPIGSRLQSDGTFTWAPGVGFVGTYDLVFARWADGQVTARRDVRIILAPKGSGHVGTQVEIDTPRGQREVQQPFLLAGWAADLDAAAGTGIDTLHVWAFPLAGGPPIFVGVPAYGGIRPDVAAVHGDRLRRSGFGLVVGGLPAGTYDLQVFPWSHVTGGFARPGIVRVTIE
jgi:uncharacterized delta-60 repeat protein